MPSSRRSSDELGRWAAERAPELLAKAEAEAVGALRDALIASAVRSGETAIPRSSETAIPGSEPGRPTRRREPQGRAAASGRDQGQLLWAYCVLRTSDPDPPDLAGIDLLGAVERVEAGELAVLLSRVPRAEFGAEPLRHNLDDLAWLERVARAHEAVLERMLGVSTIVPLRMCTLYETVDSVKQMLERERHNLIDALDGLDGRLEWGVKVLVDRHQLAEQARTRSETAATIAEELERVQGEGSAYMVQRRLERRLREECDALAAEVAHEVQARFQDWAIDAVTRPPQNRDLSGYDGEMLLNAAYLVDEDRTDQLRRLASELEARHRDLGVDVELTGPWPPYNFTPRGGLPVT